MDGWVDGWMDGWIDGCTSGECLAMSLSAEAAILLSETSGS